MKSYIFEIRIEPDVLPDGGPPYHAWRPALRGCQSWDHTYHEAMANIREAVELYVEDLRESGEEIPIDAERGSMERPTPSVAVNL